MAYAAKRSGPEGRVPTPYLLVCRRQSLSERAFVAQRSSARRQDLSLHTRRPSSGCSTCKEIAGRTGNGGSETRFAGLLHAKSGRTVQIEQNRARTVRNERESPVRPAYSVHFEQMTPVSGLSLEIARSGRAKRARNCSSRAKRASIATHVQNEKGGARAP